MKTSALFVLVGLLAGFIAGTEYGRRQAASPPDEFAANLVGALVDTISQRVSSAATQNYKAAMKSNLRNLVAAQISYFDNYATYGSTIQQIDARIASDVRIVLTHVSATGYRATASHDGLPGVRCYAVVGSAATADDNNGEGFPWCEDRQR